MSGLQNFNLATYIILNNILQLHQKFILIPRPTRALPKTQILSYKTIWIILSRRYFQNMTHAQINKQNLIIARPYQISIQ
jgi:hypothetical protein